MRKVRGFSLIELMVTITVLALLLAAAMPSFHEYLNNSRVRAVASEMRDGLQYARMEAIRRNDSVSFCMDASTGTGWNVVTGADCSAGASIRSRPASSSEASNLTLSPTSMTVTFNSVGRTSLAAGSALTTLDIAWSGTCSDDCVSMRVEVSPGGMIRSCSQNIASGPQSCATSSAASSSSGGTSSSSGGAT